MKRWILVVFFALALAVVVVIVGLTQIRLDALQEPGHVETFLATLVKHLLVRRDSRKGIPPAPRNLPASIEEGDKVYATDCSMCHGSDGRTPTDSARRGSHLARGATIPRSRIVLDCKEWNSSERDACLWKSRIRRTHLESGALSKDPPTKRTSEERSHGLKARFG
jgi:hypothetical protein